MIKEDMHVHSTFSDGENSMEENVKQAVELGLTRICCVDHVRVDTAWVPQMVAEVERLRGLYPIEIRCAVEAKILDNTGRLDAPEDLKGVDHIYAADHRVPFHSSCYAPSEIIMGLDDGDITPIRVLEELTTATIGAMQSRDNVVVAHLFSVLPKIGLTEEMVPIRLIEQIGEVATATNTPIEIDERWRCPTLATVQHLHRKGVEIWFSTDSHARADIGQYKFALPIHAMIAS